MTRSTIHKKLRKWLLLAALVATLQPLSAQQDTSGAHSFTLEESIQYALRHQNDVVNARLNRQASLEKIRESRGKLFPHVNLNGSFTDNLKLQTSYIPDFANDPNNKIPVQFGTKYSSMVQAEATQTLLNSNYFLGLRAARVYDQLSVKDFERTAIATRVAVSNAFFNVLVNRESIRLTDANLVQTSKALQDTRARYEQGVSERIDVDRLQVSYNKSETQRANLERLLQFSMDVLKFEMGMPLQETLELEDDLKSFTTEMPDSTNYSVQDRPEYSMQRTQVELDRLNLKSKKLEILPSLNAHINYGVNWFSDSFSDLYKQGFGVSALGVSLSMPLFTGTERLYQVRQRQIALQQSENNLAYLGQQIQLEVKEAWTTYRNNTASLATEEKNMALTQGVYDRVLLKFKEGVSSSLDVTTADSDLKQAQSDYIQALINALVSKVKLDQAMGKIKPQ
ncbi:TolC family protein [Chitinophaga sp.]|uniref:TolC family protein n=1 Tax=Chitinophaga sp. TaxID=1869181 RepID=UPI0031D42E87